MPFVKRNESGEIVGKFANFQEGYAEEFLEDDSPALLPSQEQLIRAALKPLYEQLHAIDASLFSIRAVRDGWMVMCLNEAAGRAPPVSEAEVYAANTLYKSMKDAETAAAPLRAAVKVQEKKLKALGITP